MAAVKLHLDVIRQMVEIIPTVAQMASIDINLFQNELELIRDISLQIDSILDNHNNASTVSF
jgi:hypothetical protein